MPPLRRHKTALDASVSRHFSAAESPTCISQTALDAPAKKQTSQARQAGQEKAERSQLRPAEYKLSASAGYFSSLSTLPI
ncbi:MAG TPA: hypothetical protein DER02_12915 [Gammaproteobacteria bacterium]|nr:hypothetical protein [Gammaproteobacteria bacterium]